VRRCRDIIDEHLSDLAGADACSAAERSIVRRAATLQCSLEQIEVKLANGEGSPSLIETYQRASNSLRRLYESLGLKRRTKDVSPPSLSDYLRQRSEADAESPDESP
jgi:hypothetical protein